VTVAVEALTPVEVPIQDCVWAATGPRSDPAEYVGTVYWPKPTTNASGRIARIEKIIFFIFYLALTLKVCDAEVVIFAAVLLQT
jgi:hypothetical protein